jgi:hypothetical protein
LRKFYNGYRFSDDETTVYNPFGLLHHFKSGGKFEKYWYETGTPSFLVDLIEKQRINVHDLGDMQFSTNDYRYDIDNMSVGPLLWQTGYLTISKYNQGDNKYTLAFPNIEVGCAFSESLLQHYLAPTGKQGLSADLVKALTKGDLPKIMQILESFIEAIPYHIIDEKHESYYHSIVYRVFLALGLHCHCELPSASGRLDTMVEMLDFIYYFEFKIDESAQDALQQIDTKRYSIPSKAKNKKVFKIGVNFSSKTRNIERWVSSPDFC